MLVASMAEDYTIVNRVRRYNVNGVHGSYLVSHEMCYPWEAWVFREETRIVLSLSS